MSKTQYQVIVQVEVENAWPMASQTSYPTVLTYRETVTVYHDVHPHTSLPELVEFVKSQAAHCAGACGRVAFISDISVTKIPS